MELGRVCGKKTEMRGEGKGPKKEYVNEQVYPVRNLSPLENLGSQYGMGNSKFSPLTPE